MWDQPGKGHGVEEERGMEGQLLRIAEEMESAKETFSFIFSFFPFFFRYFVFYHTAENILSLYFFMHLFI